MKNKVELLGYYGNDLVNAQYAWNSTSRELSEDKLARVGTLLDMLAIEGYHTPFEKSSLHFLVTVDQATHIHLLKHRIGVSINDESARYKELKEDKMYIPEDWKTINRFPKIVTEEDDENEVEYEETALYNANFDGNALQILLEDCDNKGQNWSDILEIYAELGNALYHAAIEDLTPVLGRKRAKESARFFKTMNSQITMDVMFNWRSFTDFLKLRNSEHAQKEVRELAQQMLELVEEIPGNPFQKSIKALDL